MLYSVDPNKYNVKNKNIDNIYNDLLIIKDIFINWYILSEIYPNINELFDISDIITNIIVLIGITFPLIIEHITQVNKYDKFNNKDNSPNQVDNHDELSDIPSDVSISTRICFNSVRNIILHKNSM